MEEQSQQQSKQTNDIPVSVLTDVAVMKEQLKQIQKLLEEFKSDVKDLHAYFATKEELHNLEKKTADALLESEKKRVEDQKNLDTRINPYTDIIWWALKIVLGALLVAGLSLVIIRVN